MDQKNQAIDRIKEANNILVTVSANPSVDQLAACIGLTLFFNKAGKHATAVFSGAIPSTIEFLEPEKTIEKNTDSLRDFIIALDKSKADKLRYKVEDQVVRIFITPYRTSISEKDLEFSQGDFNVDVVVALGVHHQPDLDQAITAHGRILHDATIIAINVAPGGELGSVNWIDPRASSLSELAMQLASGYDQKLVDGQIATAFLTGIVAETNRFSNAKTQPETMSISATLMGLGANQQLVATKLEAPKPIPHAAPATSTKVPTAAVKSDGTLEISHDKAGEKGNADEESAAPEPPTPQIHIDENGSLQIPSLDVSPPASGAPGQLSAPKEGGESPESAKPGLAQATLPPEPQEVAPPMPPASTPPAGLQLPPVQDEPVAAPAAAMSEPTEEAEPKEPVLPPPTPLPEPIKQEGPHLILEPPTFNSQLTANVMPEDREPSSGDPLAPPHEAELLDREPLEPSAEPTATAPVGRSISPPGGGSGPAQAAESANAPSSAEPSAVPTAGSDADTTSPAISEEPSTPTPPAGLQLPPVQDEPAASPPPVASAPADDADAALAGVNDLLGSSAPAAPQGSPTAASESLTPAASPAPPTQGTSLPSVTPSEPAISSPLAGDDSIKALTDSVANPAANVDSARDAVARAISNGATTLEPTQALNAQPLGSPLHDPGTTPPAAAAPPASGMVNPAAAPAFTPQPPVSQTANPADSSGAAPPVPPPMLPPVQL